MITRDSGAELIALCDIKPKESLGIEAYNADFYSSFDSLIEARPDVDVINICTPNGYHAQMAIKAMSAGYHVVIEKPMALNKEDAEQIIFTSLKYNKKAFCVMQNRYSPPSVWIKNMIESGKLGKIYMVQLNCYWNRDERYYKPESWHGTKDLDAGTQGTD